jgi:hypothetical protein
MPASSIAKPSKIYPNRYFCFENIRSGNPDGHEKRVWSMKPGGPGDWKTGNCCSVRFLCMLKDKKYSPGRVTRWVCEKNRPNCFPSSFFSKLIHMYVALSVEKSSQKLWSSPVIKHSPNGRIFSQSGHPVSRADRYKSQKNVSLLDSDFCTLERELWRCSVREYKNMLNRSASGWPKEFVKKSQIFCHNFHINRRKSSKIVLFR